MNNLTNKSFKSKTNGQIVKVIDHFENIAILENKQKMDARELTNPNLYSEYIDPNNFFNTQGAYNTLIDKIKTIQTENILDNNDNGTEVKIDGYMEKIQPVTNESAVIVSSELEDREALAKKYNVINNPANDLIKQQNALMALISDGDEVNEMPVIHQHVDLGIEPVQKIEINRDEDSGEVVPRMKVEDPIITMFRGVKRPLDFNISLDIKNKIPRLDFIEMMEDSYERSIIDFLANEFTNELLKNPHIIKDMIVEKIKEMVYGKEEEVKPVKRTRTTTTNKVKTPVKKTVEKKTEVKPKTFEEAAEHLGIEKPVVKKTRVRRVIKKEETENG